MIAQLIVTVLKFSKLSQSYALGTNTPISAFCVSEMWLFKVLTLTLAHNKTSLMYWCTTEPFGEKVYVCACVRLTEKPQCDGSHYDCVTVITVVMVTVEEEAVEVGLLL